MSFASHRCLRGGALIATSLAGLLAAASCSASSAKPKHSTSSSASVPAAPSSSAAHSAAPAGPAINPFTGLRPSSNRVVAVKIEDTAEARPQTGLNQADIVYVEQVEGGLTRLLAIFDTHLPSSVGPVRSTRNDDPEIMAQYGPVIYVASGGSRTEYRPLDRSNLHPVINDRGGPGFRRDANRPIPHNLFSDLSYVAKRFKAPTASSIGLTWSSRISNQASAGPTVGTTVGGTPVAFDWSPSAHRYLRYYEGHPDRLSNGQPVATANVIVQFVAGNSFPADIDPAGNPAWYQHTVGGGRVVVFRDGRRIEGRWSRPHFGSGTRLVDLKGKPIALAPGGAWFVLVNNGTALAAG